MLSEQTSLLQTFTFLLSTQKTCGGGDVRDCEIVVEGVRATNEHRERESGVREMKNNKIKPKNKGTICRPAKFYLL